MNFWIIFTTWTYCASKDAVFHVVLKNIHGGICHMKRVQI
jgi:hypothetical protein